MLTETEDALIRFVRRLESSAIALASGAELTESHRADAIKALTLVGIMAAVEPDALLRALKIRHGLATREATEL